MATPLTSLAGKRIISSDMPIFLTADDLIFVNGVVIFLTFPAGDLKQSSQGPIFLNKFAANDLSFFAECVLILLAVLAEDESGFSDG